MRSTAAWVVLLAALAPALARGQATSERLESAIGFAKGMTVDEASAVAPLRLLPRPSNAFATRDPSQVFGDYSEVVVVISPTFGLCRIMASTPGATLGTVPLLAPVMAGLTLEFGAPDPEAELAAGYLAVWTDPFGESSAVMVSLSRDRDGAVVVVVDYYFTNYLASLAEEGAGK